MAKQRPHGSGSLYRRHGTGCWTCAWTDADGRRRKRSSHTSDRRAAERILASIIADVALRRSGLIDLRMEAMADENRKPIEGHLTAFAEKMRASGRTRQHVEWTVRAVRRIADGCGWASLADVNADGLTLFVESLRDKGRSNRTIQSYLVAGKAFTRWSMRTGRLTTDPLVGVTAPSPAVDRRLERRAMDTDETRWLLSATETAPTWRKLSGPDREILYRLALGAGFRAAEIRSLTRANFRLDADPPTIHLSAPSSKHRRDDVQPISRALTDALRTYLIDRPASGPVFSVPKATAMMIRMDLRRARARWVKSTASPRERRTRLGSDFLRTPDHDGRVIDFHGLRVSFVTSLVRAGASVAQAMRLARHGDPRMTLGVYAKLRLDDVTGLLESLPTGVGAVLGAVGARNSAPTRTPTRADRDAG